MRVVVVDPVYNNRRLRGHKEGNFMFSMFYLCNFENHIIDI